MATGHEVGGPSSASGLFSSAQRRDSHCARDPQKTRFWFAAAALLLAASNAHAQVQRTIINTSFEQPFIGTGNCIRFISDTAVPGWITTDPLRGGLNTTTCQGAPIPGTSGTGRPIEMWVNGSNGGQGATPSRAGTQFVELNAFVSGRLRQDVCLLAGETVNWSASHRGRGSNTVADVMELRIGAIPIARMSTAADGNPSSITASLGTTGAPVPANGGWVDYSGQFAYTGATATVDLGFEAIFAASGSIGAGNFLDNIQINLRPFVEFAQSSYNQNENSALGNRPRLLIAGTVPTGGMTVQVTITGGTATLGLDYTTASGTADVSVFIPAGVYDSASFPLPITLVNDGPGDPGETITFNIADTAGTGAPYNLASLQSCGGAPLANTTSTISEDPDPLPRIQLTKALSANRLAVSDQFLLRITGTNGQQTTTTGAGSAVGNGTITVGPATAGSAYTLSEVMAGGSASPLSSYTSSISCTNTTPGSPTVLPNGSGTSFTLTVVASDNISCVFTNDVATAPAFIEVVKTVTSGQLYASVGDIATYRYVVTNTGPTAVNTLTVTDNKIATVSCPVTTLAIGASTTCTGSYTVTQADIDDVLVTNIATASARNGAGQVAIDTDDAVINRAFPAMTADKATTATGYATVGQVIPYTYVLTNTGNTQIDAIAVTDNRIPVVNCPVTTLNVGQSTTCSGSYTITQADIDNGSLTNLMTATGTPTAGVLGPLTDTVTLNTTRTPAFTLDKTAAVATYAAVGEVVAYSYLVTNTGNVTITALAITDDRITTVTCPVTTLAPGANTTCTGNYTITQADLDAGSVTNVATANATPPVGTTLAAINDTATITATVAPALTLSKTASTTIYGVGEVVDYSYLVTNTGNVTINALVVTDDKIATVTCPVTTLAPGASTTCTGSYTTTQADLDAGSLTNVATATGTPTQGTLTPATDTVTINAAIASDLTLAKTASTPTYAAVGEVVTYSYLLTNAGNITLNALVVTDDRIATVTCPVTTLAPGASTTCAGSYTITQADLDAGSVTNVATANATTATGTPVGPVIDTAVITTAPTPTLTLVKTASTTTYATVGEVVTYSYLVTNTGNVTINVLAVTDDRIATVTCPVTTLAPGANTICTGSYTITQADLDAGSVTNVATATGTPTQGALPPVTDTETIAATATPALTLDKTTGTATYAAVGDVVTYDYLVTNTGNVTINALAVTDDKIATVTCPVATLAPGASTTCAGSYTITQADLDAGSVTNHATANGTPASGTLTPPTDSATVTALPSVSYAKTASTADPVVVGDTITYTLSVTVSYAATTDVVTLTDTLGAGLDFVGVTSAGAFTCNAANPLVCTLPAGTAPGTYPVTYTATVNGSASGTVNNAVVGSGADNPTCPADCTIETPVAAPIITVVKSSDPVAGTQVQLGQAITYTLTVTVDNSATLGDLVLVDTPDPGLTIGTLPSGCAMNGATITCTLPAGTPAGVYTFVYSATVNAQAGASVGNQVAATVSAGQPPICDACSITHQTIAPEMRLAKTVAVREVNVGDLVRYTLTVENVGDTNLVNGSIVDTPAAGFSYVEGSLQVVDGDNQAIVEGQNPLRFTGLDVAAGQSATLNYLMRVGAGVRAGAHQNQAQAFSQTTGEPISNVATAVVHLVADPLLDDSLIFGTVFDDRDGDGWQDSAASGVDERGIPGVRIASVEGLLIETDQFGRYHLAGMSGGPWERGRNFILKVDPSTLPAGAEFTTDNPLVRRITPGIPVRFDFGVKLPVQVIEGGTEQVEMELGAVFFAPGSAEVRPQYLPVIEKMAAKVREYHGGEVVIDANGDTEALAFERANAVKAALLALLDAESAKGLVISARGNVDDPDSLVVGVDEGGTLLGTVLFDTDQSSIKPEFEPLLDKVAAALERMGGGSIAIVGHTDVRGSYDYNAALGMRRAKAVYAALAKRLSPEVRAKVRVEARDDPATPVGAERKQGGQGS